MRVWLKDDPWFSILMWVACLVMMTMTCAINHMWGYQNGWEAAWKERTKFYQTNYIPKSQRTMPMAEE